MNKMSAYTPVESVLDPSDPNRLWYYIEGFNGYEISNDGYLRSMKHYRRYPFGILLVPKKNTEQDPVFEISDNNNERQVMHRSELMNIAMHPVRAVAGYPRMTCITDRFSRNERIFTKKKVKRNLDEVIGIPDFTK